MPVTELQIAKKALARIGITTPLTSGDGTIAAITESNEYVRQIALFYEGTRDALVQAFPWGRHSKYAALELIDDGEDDAWTDKWAAAYTYPIDCLCFRGFVGWSLGSVPTALIDQEWSHYYALTTRWALGYHDSETVIFAATDEEAPFAHYIAQRTDLDPLGPAFESALAWALAAELADPLKVDAAIAQRAEQKAHQSMLVARALSANEEDDPTARDGSFVTSRGG